ncbi:uncharacterized protein DFL_009279 [Arthrobotrys flagrans]|uniref:Uncharacterized protein n=1 Tax=Arthrobotrys flagrans TaxID=97331 RepID=A0A436ZRC1_ARTFL|nr:hypothetical protein DFL_009279 [Arthrobotrys flagrans]
MLVATQVVSAINLANWSSSITIAASKDSNGNLIVTVSEPATHIDNSANKEEKDTCTIVIETFFRSSVTEGGRCSEVFRFSKKPRLFYSLVALTVATKKNSSLTFDYSPGNPRIPETYRNFTYNSIAVPTAQVQREFTSSDLYICASTGVYRIPGGKADRMEQIIVDIKNAYGAAVTLTADSISLWVAASPNYLDCICRRKSDTKYGHVKWSPPLKFATNALHVCSMRNTVTDTNEVFTVNLDASISHYWQDLKSTNWFSKKASLKGKSFVVDQKPYTSQIQIVSDGVPLSNFEVKITSSEWQYCLINGLMYSLDIANDGYPPILHLQSNSFSETINIYPNGKIQHYLRGVKSGDDLRAARTQDGKQVLDPSITKDLSDSVAGNISSLNDIIRS